MFWQFRRELTATLCREHEVVISTPFVGHEEDLAALGCRTVETAVDRRGINPVTDLKLYRFYRALLKKEKPDLVITYSIKPNIYAGMACRLMKIPYAVNVQGLGTAFQRPLLATVAKWLYKIALKKAKTTFFENTGNAAEFVSRGIQTADRQTILAGAGINLAFHTYQPYPQNDKIHLLFIGRIMTEKGMDELFAAARTLCAEGVPFVLDLVGFYEDEYKETVDRLVEDGIAVFHGFQSDPRPYYAAADAVVLPSYHEGMSNVLLEAAATGRPIITSDIPGCREAVDGEKNGFLVPVRDAAALTAVLRRFCGMSPDERVAMGAAGRAFMEATFDKNRVVEQTVAALLDDK